MKKAILLFSLLTAVAHATPITPAELIYPNKAALQAACDAGYRNGSAGKLGLTPEFTQMLIPLPRKQNSLLDKSILSGFQLPSGGIYSECSQAAQGKKPKPQGNFTSAGIVVLSGPSERFDQLKKVTVELSFRDRQFNEVFRMRPDMSPELNKAFDEMGSCKDCKDKAVMKLFDFDALSVKEKAAALKAQTVHVVLEIGQVEERLVLPNKR